MESLLLAQPGLFQQGFQGLGFRVSGLEFRVQGLGFRLSGARLHKGLRMGYTSGLKPWALILIGFSGTLYETFPFVGTGWWGGGRQGLQMFPKS